MLQHGLAFSDESGVGRRNKVSKLVRVRDLNCLRERQSDQASGVPTVRGSDLPPEGQYLSTS